MDKLSNQYSWRLYAFLIFLSLLLLGLVGRLVDLTIFKRHFLIEQSDARILRKVTIPAHRGMIVDRFGTPLAISTPVDSIWANPKLYQANPQQLTQLANLLELNPDDLNLKLSQRAHSFVYLKRHVSPPIAEQIQALKIPGIYLQPEFQRYYPQGEITAQVLGFTNIDDQGQEGLELAYNQWLSGTPGQKEVIKDRLGNIIENVAVLKLPEQGHILELSLDHRLQYLANRYLRKAMTEFKASSGSVVILDAHSGEVLAMVNQPAYNPNNRPTAHDDRFRNRAVTDMFEPGSTIKPFTIALALMSGKYVPEQTIDTNPGWMHIGGYTIRDDGYNYGVINLTQILEKSSNIGAAKIMLSLPPQNFWQLLRNVGFGQNLGTGFPGEATGRLQAQQTWRPSVVATLAYGYGIAATALQLAHAYSVLANDGISKPVLFLKASPLDKPKGVRVLPADISHTVLDMLEDVVMYGTGRRAQIFGYRVGGKTGTAYIAGPHGYDKTRYTSSFVGIAPISNPRLVIAVIIRDPHGQSFGALVAAPVFARVMDAALRLLDIPPDNISGIIPPDPNKVQTVKATPSNLAESSASNLSRPKNNLLSEGVSQASFAVSKDAVNHRQNINANAKTLLPTPNHTATATASPVYSANVGNNP